MSNASLRHDWDCDCGHDFFDHLQTGKYFERVWILSGTTHFPQYLTTVRAANYCRTSDNVRRLNLANVRAKVVLIVHWSDDPITKKLSHYTFFAVTKSDANSLNLHFAIKFTRHSSILFNIAPEWLYILVS